MSGTTDEAGVKYAAEEYFNKSYASRPEYDSIGIPESKQ
jgi:hypothetical protein